MKKTIAFILAMMMCLSLCACSSSPDNSNQATTPKQEDINSSNNNSGIVQKEYPKYEDIEVYFVNGVSYGEPAALMGYTNNSSYTIVSMILNYTIKADATDEELSVFDSFVEDGDLEEEKIQTLTPSIYNHMVCDPGESVEGATCTIWGNHDATSADQCAIMEIKSAQISFLGNDGLVYTVAYAAENDGYTLQNGTESPKSWTELDFATSIPTPDTRFITVNYDEADYYQFTAYDITYDQYRSYCEECQNAGFTNEIEDNDISFWCTNNDGLTLNIKYYAYMNALIVYAK